MSELERAIAAEKQAARFLDLRGSIGTLVAAVIAWVLSLFLEQTAGTRGFEVFAGGPGVTIVELVFAVLSAAGMVMTILALATRRTTAAWIAWMLVGVATFVALWAFWTLGARDGAGLGFWVGELGNLLALVGFSRVTMRKSAAQREAEAHTRKVATQLDEVGTLQAEINRPPAADDNPLLVDDRRARAARRHQRGATGSEEKPGEN